MAAGRVGRRRERLPRRDALRVEQRTGHFGADHTARSEERTVGLRHDVRPALATGRVEIDRDRLAAADRDCGAVVALIELDRRGLPDSAPIVSVRRHRVPAATLSRPGAGMSGRRRRGREQRGCQRHRQPDGQDLANAHDSSVLAMDRTRKGRDERLAPLHRANSFDARLHSVRQLAQPDTRPAPDSASVPPSLRRRVPSGNVGRRPGRPRPPTARRRGGAPRATPSSLRSYPARPCRGG